MLIKPDIRG